MLKFPAAFFLTMLVAGPVAAELHTAVEQALCDAATEESAVPAQIDALVDGGLVEFAQVGQIISLRCESDRSMLEVLVQERQAENLEYLVVDMGLDIEQPLNIGGRQLSVNDYLADQAANGSESVREFASEYLELFADKDFNPGLWLSMQ